MRIMAIVLIAFLIAVGSNIALADNQTTQIKEALIRWLCYDAYWRGGIPSSSILRRTLPIEIKTETDKFYVWINDLEITEVDHIAGFYMGRLKNSEAAVIMSEAPNLNATPLSQQKRRHYFESRDVVKDNLTMPANCMPQYDPMTAHKELMINIVASTVQKQMSETVRLGISKYPMEVTLIIADFNIDYPYSYIMVEPVNEVYRVTLHDPQNYDSDEYEREGEYPFGEEYSVSKELLEKIHKHGIIRKITLTP